MPRIAPCCDTMSELAQDANNFWCDEDGSVHVGLDSAEFGISINYCPFCGKKLGVSY